MKKSELIAALTHMRDDDEVVIALNQNGVGGTPNVGIESVHHGFDWDNGRILLHADAPIATESFLKNITDKARKYEKLLYFWACEMAVSWKVSGKPLMSAQSMPKGSTVRQLKDFMKQDVDEWLNPKP